MYEVRKHLSWKFRNTKPIFPTTQGVIVPAAITVIITTYRYMYICISYMYTCNMYTCTHVRMFPFYSVLVPWHSKKYHSQRLCMRKHIEAQVFRDCASNYGNCFFVVAFSLSHDCSAL